MSDGQQITGKMQGGVANLTNAGKGRKKGVPNKATTAIKDMIIAALDKAGGIDYLNRQADENPAAFMTLVGKVLPMQITGNLNINAVHRIERPVVDPTNPDS